MHLKTFATVVLLTTLVSGCATAVPPKLIGKGRVLEVVALNEATLQRHRVNVAVAFVIPIPSSTPVATPWRLYTVRLLDGTEVKKVAEGQLLIGTCVTLREQAAPAHVVTKADHEIATISPSEGC